MSNYNNMYLSTMKQDYVKINKSYNLLTYTPAKLSYYHIQVSRLNPQRNINCQL